MKSITKSQNGTDLWKAWAEVLAVLPTHWAEGALQYKALQRRRGIGSAEDLLHVGLGYSVLDKSLTALGSWAVGQGLANISAPALYEHLCAARPWFGWLLGQCLAQRQLHLPQAHAVSVVIRDATVISRPGSQGTDWRVHLALNLGDMRIEGIDLTDASGSERLERFASPAEQIVLADRAYAHQPGLGVLLASGARCVIRLTWSNLCLEDAQSQPWQVTDWLRQAFAAPQTQCQEQTVYLPGPHTPVRVCAVRLAPEKAALAVQRARRQAEKKGHTPDARTLIMAQFVVVLTNLSAQVWTPRQVLDLYRVRWQVELFFKRLKSILYLDHLRARKPPLAQTYLLGKLLAACLLEGLTQRFVHPLPQGFSTTDRPLSQWALTALLWEQFQTIIRGPLRLETLLANPQHLQRFLCTPPRKRKQQLASVRSRLEVVAQQRSSCPAPLALS